VVWGRWAKAVLNEQGTILTTGAFTQCERGDSRVQELRHRVDDLRETFLVTLPEMGGKHCRYNSILTRRADHNAIYEVEVGEVHDCRRFAADLV
jgi:hypothetical protein